MEPELEKSAPALPSDETGAPVPRPARPLRKAASAETAPERGRDGRRSGFDRRRGPGRRRTDYRRAAEEGCMNEEQLDFLKAIDEYKRVNNRPFPSWTEVLDVVLFLGYRRVAPVGEFKLCKGRQTPLPQAKDEPEE